MKFEKLQLLLIVCFSESCQICLSAPCPEGRTCLRCVGRDWNYKTLIYNAKRLFWNFSALFRDPPSTEKTSLMDFVFCESACELARTQQVPLKSCTQYSFIGAMGDSPLGRSLTIYDDFKYLWIQIHVSNKCSFKNFFAKKIDEAEYSEKNCANSL